MLEILKEKNVRMIWSEGFKDVWFSANDVAEELGIVQVRSTLRNIDGQYKKKFNISSVQTMHGRNFETDLPNFGELFISEEAVYNLTFRSNKPEAKLFTIWVSKVLKQLRINGYYIVNEKDEQWLGKRQESKANNVEYNVAIKMLVDYAYANGSGSANRYYTIFAREIRTCLHIPTDLDKDDLSEEQLERIISKENEVAKMIPVFVKMKLPYKDIYKATKAVIN